MKKFKEMIIPILVGFTFVISIYSTIKISELEYEIGQLDRELEDKIGTSERDELNDSIYEIIKIIEKKQD
ncbi:MAG: hypothetical protein P8L91_04240 [Candidatus Marinimicrobia bacterium]|jgi:hypothetical protein|nr:hypothetical protein [Candidatus Neomarinimicrobiota bacterium]MDG2266175.1 hypothetical protein [Candidatus Neomarinimicrobiota bacterium]|tara:strand:+ start:123 stop:332 length:210 start_codon:yes stop_codon:yes gene_type:complete